MTALLFASGIRNSPDLKTDISTGKSIRKLVKCLKGNGSVSASKGTFKVAILETVACCVALTNLKQMTFSTQNFSFHILTI